nr:bifunctional phosphoribosyl-AMP cyclohydrolase/phosphoribosyl-ATP diphosphatase HisIE [Butyrivibrio sp. MC2013]
MIKEFIPSIILRDGKVFDSFKGGNSISSEPVKLAEGYNDAGADALIVFDQSTDDASHDKALDIIKDICHVVDIPVIGGGNIKRMEDVKKMLYAGCKACFLSTAKESNMELLEEVSLKFGKEKIMICYADKDEEKARGIAHSEDIKKYASSMIVLPCAFDDNSIDSVGAVLPKELDGLKGYLYISSFCDKDRLMDICLTFMNNDLYLGATGTGFINGAEWITDIKEEVSEAGMEVKKLTSSFKWEDFKKDNAGLVPVVVQDYRTSQVLMLAYMNEEAFNTTIRTGKMTYYSRSRQELWIKGLTSGHFQFVKSLSADCDMDTILAKVKQIGVACHTGSYSCFFNQIAEKEYDKKDPSKVLSDVYNVIADRKIHPKEGSYTNYLFDKGIDKILKKCGEEATEITIAAKNPGENEIVYEIADYLYHMMVLMVEKNVRWEDITDELTRRE